MNFILRSAAALFLLNLMVIQVAVAQKTDKAAVINVDFQQKTGKMYPAWAWFGYDEPNYTYMKDGKKLLSEIAALSPVPVYVRAHSLLVTDDGTRRFKMGHHQYVYRRCEWQSCL